VIASLVEKIRVCYALVSADFASTKSECVFVIFLTKSN